MALASHAALVVSDSIHTVNLRERSKGYDASRRLSLSALPSFSFRPSSQKGLSKPRTLGMMFRFSTIAMSDGSPHNEENRDLESGENDFGPSTRYLPTDYTDCTDFLFDFVTIQVSHTTLCHEGSKAPLRLPRVRRERRRHEANLLFFPSCLGAFVSSWFCLAVKEYLYSYLISPLFL